MKNIMLPQKTATQAGMEKTQSRHFRPGRAAKRFLGMAVLAGTIMVMSSTMSFAQDRQAKDGGTPDSSKTTIVKESQKVMLYPNLSSQGVAGNPALTPDLGDWGYVSYNMGKEPSATFQVSNAFRGVQLNGAYTSNDSWMANGSMKLAGNLNVGATFTPDNKKGIIGAVYRPIHTENNMTQAGAQFDLGSKTVKLSAETRFPINKSIELTVSGQASFDKKEVKNKGFGFQWAIDKFRTSFGIGGKDKTAINVAEQVNLGNNLLPDAGISIENGKVTGGWIGILKLF